VENTEVVEVELPDGSVVLARVEIRDGDVAALDRFKLDAVAANAARLGHWVKDSILDVLPTKPDRFGVQVGLDLVVQSGVLTSIIASASTQASFAVTMEWDRERQS
jgi:hypothetical protein